MTTNKPFITNNHAVLSTEVGRFSIEQRNVGFSDNDGRWMLTILPKYGFGPNGRVFRRRPGRFIGAYDNLTLAVRAMNDFDTPPAETNTPLN